MSGTFHFQLFDPQALNALDDEWADDEEWTRILAVASGSIPGGDAPEMIGGLGEGRSLVDAVRERIQAEGSKEALVAVELLGRLTMRDGPFAESSDGNLLGVLWPLEVEQVLAFLAAQKFADTMDHDRQLLVRAMNEARVQRKGILMRHLP